MIKNYLSGFRSFLSVKINRILILVVVLTTSGLCILYNNFSHIYEKALNEQMLHREQIAARAGAKAMELVLKVFIDQTRALSEKPSMSAHTQKTQDDLDSFMSFWEGYPVGGVLLTDSRGIVIYNSNILKTHDVGADLSQRDYFLNLKNGNLEVYSGVPVVSAVGGSKGKYIVPIVAPVYVNGKFDGVVAISVVLSDLGNKYFDQLKISEDTKIYVFNSDGYIVQSPSESLLGVKWEISGEFKSVLQSSDEAKLIANLPEETNLNVNKYLLAVSKIKVGDNLWSLAVATPEKSALKFAWPFENYSVVILIYVLLVIIALSAVSIIVLRIAKRDGYLEGLADGKKITHRS